MIITATFSLCSIVSSEEETTDSNPTPTLPKSDEGKPEGEAKSPDLINPSININADLLQTAPRLSKRLADRTMSVEELETLPKT